jgi:hypothetical protein
VCESCANAKARQKNMPKISAGEKATVINGQWFHDSSTLKVHKGEKGSSKIWDLTDDESQESHLLGYATRKMSLLRACASAFNHRQPEVTLS